MGFLQARPYPKPSATAPSMLKEAFRQRGGVVKERDGFEVFYGMERPERNERPSGAKTARGRKSVDLRDGFDKFYGIPSGAAEDSSSSPKKSREDLPRGAQCDGPGGDKPGTQLAASTSANDSNASAPLGVPAGVPTFHLAEPALPKGVETFSICRRADEARPVNGER